MSLITKEMLEQHAKLIQQKLGVVVKTDVAAADTGLKAEAKKFAPWVAAENTKFEALVKTHPAVVGLIAVSALFGFVLGFLVGHIS